MRCLILSLTRAQGLRRQTMLEGQREGWLCEVETEAGKAYALLCAGGFEVCAVCDCPEGRALTSRLWERPPVAPPWLAAEFSCPVADMVLRAEEAAVLPAMVEARELAGHVPCLALCHLLTLNCLARGLLRQLGMREGLGAWRFLPDMAALTAAHPPLLHNLKGGLYPLAARRHGLRPDAVERSLRLAVESTWMRGSLPGLERFFGHSVDPERGKPTNREFLFRLQEHLTLASRRFQ